MNNLSKWYVCILLLVLLGCNNQSTTPGSNKTSNDSGENLGDPSNSGNQKIDTPVQNDSSLPGNKKTLVNITGNWALVGTDATTFLIDKKEIFYPESSASYPYKIENDTLKIKYTDYEGAFLIKKSHMDTLVLANDDVQVYYRFHK